jgi:hypothetical protein
MQVEYDASLSDCGRQDDRRLTGHQEVAGTVNAGVA